MGLNRTMINKVYIILHSFNIIIIKYFSLLSSIFFDSTFLGFVFIINDDIIGLVFVIHLSLIKHGDWGLGIGPNPQSPIPNPQSPIPNPQITY